MATMGLTSADERRYTDADRRFVSGRDWGGIAAGAIAGLATALLLTTLGGALGLSAGAAAADEVGSVGQTATAFGVGAAIWAAITAIATGIVGGLVFASFAREGSAMRAVTGAMITWSLGIVLAVMLASTSTVGAMTMTGTAAGQWLGTEGRAESGALSGEDRDRSAVTTGVAEAERRQVAEAAARTAATAAWVLFACQVLGLIATVVATKAALQRVVGAEVPSRVVLNPA